MTAETVRLLIPGMYLQTNCAWFVKKRSTSADFQRHCSKWMHKYQKLFLKTVVLRVTCSTVSKETEQYQKMYENSEVLGLQIPGKLIKYPLFLSKILLKFWASKKDIEQLNPLRWSLNSEKRHFLLLPFEHDQEIRH